MKNNRPKNTTINIVAIFNTIFCLPDLKYFNVNELVTTDTELNNYS
jgi:hypothetical protein